MILIKTIAIFIINKLLELWYIGIKDNAKWFLGCILTIVFIFILFDAMGFVTIALVDLVGLHDLAYRMCISAWNLDTPFIIRGILLGFSECMLIAICAFIVISIKESNIKQFITSNWNLAKQGKFYSHK